MISVKIDNREVTKQLSILNRGLKDLSKPFKKTGKELSEEFFGKEVFDTQGGAIDARWKGHAASTAVARARRWGHYSKGGISTGQILVWTGTMKKGFTFKASKNQVMITNGTFYFKYNQPERKMLDINNNVEKIVEDIFDEYCESLTK